MGKRLLPVLEMTLESTTLGDGTMNSLNKQRAMDAFNNKVKPRLDFGTLIKISEHQYEK